MKKIKVDFVVPPFSGHLNPQIELATPLLNKNFEIRFITGPNKVEFLKKLGFNAIPVLFVQSANIAVELLFQDCQCTQYHPGDNVCTAQYTPTPYPREVKPIP